MSDGKGTIYGDYGGPLCEHYGRLSYLYHRRGQYILDDQSKGLSHVVAWAGSLTPGPHHGQNANVICLARARNDNYGGVGDDLAHWRILTETEVLAIEMPSKQFKHKLRGYQAELAEKHGFKGPIKGGEARALSRFLRAIGKEDCVRRLWLNKGYVKVRWPGTAWERRIDRTTLGGPYYAFKPFMDGVTFDDFMRIFRMMRPGCKDARKAIREAMANPTMKEDLEMLSVFDTMADMGGSK